MNKRSTFQYLLDILAIVDDQTNNKTWHVRIMDCSCRRFYVREDEYLLYEDKIDRDIWLSDAFGDRIVAGIWRSKEFTDDELVDTVALEDFIEATKDDIEEFYYEK